MKRNLFLLILITLCLTTLSLGCGEEGNGNNGNNPNTTTTKTTTVYSGCTKDADCGDANKCVVVEGYAVCAKGCASDPTVCGTQKCDERDKKEGGGKEKVCVTPSSAPRTSKEGEVCDKAVTCENGLICVADIHGPEGPSDKGTCQKLKECDSHDTCKNDANAPQCLYVMDVEKKEHRVCGKCDGFKFHCEYGTEVCVSQPPSMTTGLCQPRCFEDKDCSTPGTECRRPWYPSTQGEICRNPKEAGYHEPCSKKSGNEIGCSEGFVCVSYDPANNPEQGNCLIACSIDSKGKESKECSPEAPYCTQADIAGDPSPTKGLACSDFPTGSSTPPGPTRTGKEGDTCTKSELCDNSSSLVCIANERRGEEGTCQTFCSNDGDCTPKKCKHVDLRAFSVADFGSPMPLGLTVGYCSDK